MPPVAACGEFAEPKVAEDKKGKKEKHKRSSKDKCERCGRLRKEHVSSKTPLKSSKDHHKDGSLSLRKSRDHIRTPSGSSHGSSQGGSEGSSSSKPRTATASASLRSGQHENHGVSSHISSTAGKNSSLARTAAVAAAEAESGRRRSGSLAAMNTPASAKVVAVSSSSHKRSGSRQEGSTHRNSRDASPRPQRRGREVATEEVKTASSKKDDPGKSSGAGAAAKMDEQKKVGEYLLTKRLGTGAYGEVWQGLSMVSGAFVAVKMLNMRRAPREEIEALQQEIKLMESLVHDNIVRYLGQEEDTATKRFCIVMELVEGGSLQKLVHDYGRFPESLAKTYTVRVLHGMGYLHSQGVIHRDIKPDNILVTKDGNVKLADFGVSTKLAALEGGNQVDDQEVPAGTPFYMAPEVIEFQGAKPESDVWSLGCTIIELLVGEPPYFKFDAFAAMYKMVEDEHPPLPPGISVALEQFLLLCFKPVDMRPLTPELLKHRWLKVDGPQYVPSQAAAAKPALMATAGVGSVDTSAIMEIQDYEKELRRQLDMVPAASIPPAVAAPPAPSTAVQDAKAELLAQLGGSLTPPDGSDSEMSWGASSDDEDASKKKVPLGFALDLGGSFSGLDALAAAAGPNISMSKAGNDSDSMSWADSDGEEPAVPSTPAPLAGMLGPKEEVAKPKKVAPPNKKLGAPLAGMLGHISMGDDDDDDGAAGLARIKAAKAGDTSLTSAFSAPRSLGAYAEKEDSDFDDDFGDSDFASATGSKNAQPLRLAVQPDKSATTAGDSDDEVDFDDWLDDRDEETMMREKARDEAEKAQLADIQRLLRDLKADSDDKLIQSSCKSLQQVFEANPSMIPHLITSHGLLPMITLMSTAAHEITLSQQRSRRESKRERVGEEASKRKSPEERRWTRIVLSVLRLITPVIAQPDVMVNLCVMGAIPAIISVGQPNHSLLTRMYCSYFVTQVIQTTETLQMFVACRGIGLLVQFLSGPFAGNEEIISNGLDCVWNIFHHQARTATPKNEFFHLFINQGLLPRLAAVFVELSHRESSSENSRMRRSESAMSAVSEADDPPIVTTAHVFRLFATGDTDVKLALCDKQVMGPLAQAFGMLDPKSKPATLILQMIKQLTYERACLGMLSDHWILPLLNLAKSFASRQVFVNEIFNNVTLVFYHFCRFSRPRQLASAQHGIIPVLQFVVEHNKPLKDFAVPLVCDLAKDRGARAIMIDGGGAGIRFYKYLLADTKDSASFHPDALLAIANCLAPALRAEAERQALDESDTGSIVKLICDVARSPLEHKLGSLLDGIQKILEASAKISAALVVYKATGNTSVLVDILRSKLSHHSPLVRVSLLKLLNQLCRSYPIPRNFLVDTKLLEVVRHMASADSAELARGNATMLLKAGSSA